VNTALNIVLFVALAAIFFVVLTTVFKKNRNNPPVMKGWRSLITQYYVTIATGLWFSFRKFFITKRKRMAYEKNKCEAGGALTGNEMTLRSMGNEMNGQRKTNYDKKKEALESRQAHKFLQEPFRQQSPMSAKTGGLLR